MKHVRDDQVAGFVALIEDALKEGIVATRALILEFALKNRKKHLRYGELTPMQIRENLQMFLDKLTSGGRIGVAYFQKGTAR